MSGGRSRGLPNRRSDLLALSNLRSDGRKPHEIRRVQMELGTITGSMGSATVKMGLTSCIAVVSGPMECIRRSDEILDRAILDVSFQIAPYATADRRVHYPNSDRRLIESALQIQHALEAAILLQTYPKSRITIHITVLYDDGGTICTAINAATLAVMDAGIPMKDFCCSCTAGGTVNITSSEPTNNTILVDLNRMEEMNNNATTTGNVYLPVAILPQTGTVVMAQCMESRLPNIESMNYVIEAAIEGCRMIHEYMQIAVHERATTLMKAYNTNLST